MKPILTLQGISKKYAGIQALSNMDIEFYSGQIHSIVGENGAGKSTLIQIITGAVSANSGQIYLDNQLIKNMSPEKSKHLGIAPVYQELNLILQLKVYENIFYGRELRRGFFLDTKSMRKQAQAVLDSLGSSIDIDATVDSLGIGSRQIIEIAKALMDKPKIILLDEPTASLSISESKILHDVIKSLCKQGIAVIFVSHKLDEVLEISDTITVLRDGVKISTRHRTESWANICDIPTLVADMLGKSLAENVFADHTPSAEPVLRLENLSNHKIHNINLSLYPGEILSVSGLLGSMRTELLNTIFSLEKIESGKIFVKEKQRRFQTPIQAIEAGIGYVTEDRKDSGLFMELSILENMSISSLGKFQKYGFIDQTKEARQVKELLEKLNVKYSSLHQKVKELSGGNQQKIAIAKWLMVNPDILLLDEPTRGVDVGAKEEIYKIIFDLAQSGKAILMVSSDAEEVIRLSDRTLVMRNGKLTAQYQRGNITAEKIYDIGEKYAETN